MSEHARIPLANPRQDHEYLTANIMRAVADILAAGNYVLGGAVDRFEKEMARRLGVSGTVGVASGTDALAIALLGLGVGPGDEVITVSHTAGPTVAAIRMAGAIPVFVDIESETYCLDPAHLEAAIGPLTKAVIVVHLYGHPVDMHRVMGITSRFGIPVVEDCAQAQEATINGRQVGSIGSAGCFSFYPTKNLGAIGDGGLVTARNEKLIKHLRAIRTYGWIKSQFAEVPHGRCSRLDEIQAAILSVKLGRLTEAVERRRSLARRYQEAFADIPIVLPSERSDVQHAYHLFVIRSDRRDLLINHLDNLGISTGIHYPYPVHLQPALAEGARIPETLQVTERIAPEILSLPLFPSMSEQQLERVISGVCSFFREA